MPTTLEERPETPAPARQIREGVLAGFLVVALCFVGWKWQHSAAQAQARNDIKQKTRQAQQPDTRPLNHLAGSTSPYLLQHSHNPVDWYPWGEEAIQLARKLNRPIFLSVGYSACHWCHVMEREDFENPDIARILNQSFVCIKVDREERPDIDSQYMTAVQMMTGSGGWPMSVWLTPDLKPFYGGTYYPADQFQPLLQKIAALWSSDPVKVRAAADQVSVGMRQALDAAARKTADAIPPDSIAKAEDSFLRDFDPVNGGFGTKPKFPDAPRLRFLLEQQRRSPSPKVLALLTRTLDAMARGGIFDQIGGGFHRYSTDAQWHVPHFEKMLYDQAQLAQVYLQAYQLTRETLYLQTAQRTLDFVLREMTDAKTGAFYATLDADSEGEEGKYYLWTAQEIETALGKADAGRIDAAYGVTPAGSYTGGNNILYQPLPVSPGEEATLAPLRVKLLTLRGERIRPSTDDKVIAGWNGLMIGAFAKAYAVNRDERYRKAAQNAVDFLASTLTKPDGSLLRAARLGKPGTVSGFLDDYAYASDGLLDLWAATGEERYRTQAQSIAQQMLRRFWDNNGSGGFLLPGPTGAPVSQSRSGEDDATPSPTGVAAQVLSRLAALPASPGQPPAQAAQYRRQVSLAVQSFQPLIARSPSAFPTLLLAWQSLNPK